MKHWLVIATALVLLAVLVGSMLRQQGMFPPARSAASRAPADEHVIPAVSAGSDRNPSAASIKPTDAHTMRYLQTLLETWKSHAQEPTLQKP
jgi:hypothetical protein